MRTLFSKIAFTAALMLAITFTFSCSGDSGGGGGNGEQSNISSSTEANVETSSSSKGTDKSSSSSEVEDNSSSSSFSSTGGSSSSKGSESSLVKKDKISGFSQKGPFTKGSAITLSELNDKLAQTGFSFEEIITDDKGSFEMKNIELASPYAMLKANGYYRNEISGEISKAPINLFAITDIREKSNVNVNILTHLEYYRVQKLVEGGKSLKDAKKQAQKEILAVFGISGQFKDSEDMSIFGTSDGDAALLAISVLLQGNLTEGQFTERLADFSLGFRETGKWDNKKEKDAIADWAFNNKRIEYCDYAQTPQDPKNCYPMPTGDMCRTGKIVPSCSGGSEFHTVLSLIRSNILGWKFSSSVPDFEKYVNNYWSTYFGACDAKKAGEIIGGSNGTKYICKDNAWVTATEKEVACENKSKSCFTDARDNQLYLSVKIGKQTWMAENMNYNATGSKCYDNKPANCEQYGRLYNWVTAMDIDTKYEGENLNDSLDIKHKGICPTGWHLPNYYEWEELINFAGGENVAGNKLKAFVGWNNNYCGERCIGTDDYSFSALPGGYGSSGGFFRDVGNYGSWWGSSWENGTNAHRRKIRSSGDEVDGCCDDKSNLLSVRCLQD